MSQQLKDAFQAMGAALAEDRFGRGFAIDIVTRSAGEAYQLQRPWDDELSVDVLDVKPHLRHLVLDVSGWRLPISGRYLCGRDESQWFVAGVTLHRKTETVRGAIESLKPDAVRREQRRKGVKGRSLRRKTPAYIRQGEWFFLPRPKMQVAESLVERDGRLVRGEGKPHRVDELYRVAGRDEIFVRGRVRHVDHQTLHQVRFLAGALFTTLEPDGEATGCGHRP